MNYVTIVQVKNQIYVFATRELAEAAIKFTFSKVDPEQAARAIKEIKISTRPVFTEVDHL